MVGDGFFIDRRAAPGGPGHPRPAGDHLQRIFIVPGSVLDSGGAPLVKASKSGAGG
jgi:hypothetical protein